MRHFTSCAWQIVARPPELRETIGLDEVVMWSKIDEIPVVALRSPSERPDMTTVACSGYGNCEGGTVEVPTADVFDKPNSPALTLALHVICTESERTFVDGEQVVVISRPPPP